MAGSEGFARTRSVGGESESVVANVESPTSGPWVHVAIVYGADDTITLYRNGEVYGESYRAPSPLRTLPNRNRMSFWECDTLVVQTHG